jgi:predicted RNA-binding Zn-ribbon protein involved in translation (DUF1610 family)
MENPRRVVSLATPSAELVDWFLEDLGVERRGDTHTARFSDHEIDFILPGESGDPGEVQQADVLVGLIRFVDILTLREMEQKLLPVAGSAPVALAMVVYRDEQETDFKMSCPFCGQKLWVRDADTDKRGRCPHCKKGFTLPEQEEHVRAILQLPDSVPVVRVHRKDAGSMASPLRKILSLKKESVLDHLDGRTPAANQTMNVDVEE